jgi:P pilus assembly chaperone PapD
MRYLKAIAIIVIVLAIGFCAFLPTSTSAQEGIRVWPTRVEMMVNRGEEAGKTINIYNQGSEPIRVSSYAMDFSIERDGEFDFYEPGHQSYSASKWLNIEKADFELAPGESREVEVVVSAPATVEPGGHYAALFFEAVPSGNQSAVSVSMRIPTLFYITIPGITGAEVIANADIVSLQLPGVAGRGPVEMGVVVRNSGNVHLTVAARAHFAASWGNASELDLGQMVILPSSDGVLKGEWQRSPLFGKVRASVVIGYLDQKGELVNKSQTAEFWVVPWSLVGIILFVMGVVVPAIVIISKRFRLRVERK